MTTQTTPDLPWIVGLTLLTLMTVGLGALCFAWLAKWLRLRKDPNAYDYDGPVPAIFAGVFVLFFGAVALVVAIPFDMDYHQYRHVYGPVSEISKRLIAEGKGMSERYVVVVDGHPYAVDDTRASLLKAGDDVTLSCKREWQWAAESGWACNWGVQ